MDFKYILIRCLFIIWSLVSLVKNEDEISINEETFYVNTKTTSIGSFIGKINDLNKTFETPYYLIPIEPLVLNDLKSVLNINLDNGKIFLQSNAIKLNTYKFTILSILKGTSKQIKVIFLQQHESSTIASTTKSFLINEKFISINKNILKTYYFLLNSSQIKSNTIIGKIDLANSNAKMKCISYCNFMQVSNYFIFDAKTSSLILTNSNLNINFFIIEIYNDNTTVLLAYIKILLEPINWIDYSTVVLNNYELVLIRNNDYAFINDTILKINGYQQLLIENDSKILLNNSNQQLFQTIKFVEINCNTTTLCQYSFGKLKVKFESLSSDNNQINY